MSESPTQVTTTVQPDATKVLQELLGINTLVQTITGVFKQQGSQDYLVTTIEKSMKNLLNDPRIEGTMANSVFSGIKRVLTDAECQTAFANIAVLFVQNQAMSNLMEKFSTELNKQNKDFFSSEAFSNTFKPLIEKAVSDVQETLILQMDETSTKSMAAIQEAFNMAVNQAFAMVMGAKVVGSFHLDKSSVVPTPVSTPKQGS